MTCQLVIFGAETGYFLFVKPDAQGEKSEEESEKFCKNKLRDWGDEAFPVLLPFLILCYGGPTQVFSPRAALGTPQRWLPIGRLPNSFLCFGCSFSFSHRDSRQYS